jgi:TonB family protein
MKYLTIFCILMVQSTFGQAIDCAELAKINQARVNQKITVRSHTFSTAKSMTIESTMEMDAAKNIRITTKMPQRANMKMMDSETRVISGKMYSRNPQDSVWYFRSMPPKDSMKTAESMKTINQGTDCKIVGTETIEGKVFSLVESSLTLEQLTDKPVVIKTWVDLKDSVVKKTEVNQELKSGLVMKIVTEYGVAIVPIEKPLNAVADSLKPKLKSPTYISGSYADRNKRGTVMIPEQNPEYKDGQRALFDFLNRNLIYPQAAKDAKLQGTVYVKFFVETDGTIKDVTVARGIGSGCDEAAIDVIKKMSGDWRCAMDGGKPVRTQFTLPVKFKL